MLEDFLEENRLDAELISFPEKTSIQKALFELKMSPHSSIRVDFFFGENSKCFLCIFPQNSKLDIARLKQLAGPNISFPIDEEVEEVTGYSKGFLPPVAIYGVGVFFDKSLEGKDYLLCRVSEKDFLKISPDSIVEANEDINIAPISKKE